MVGSVSSLDHVRGLIAGILPGPLPELNADTPLETVPGWDSIVMVRLVILLEEQLGQQLDDAKLEQIEKVGDIEKLVSGS